MTAGPPRVGVGVVVLSGGRVLLGLRKRSHGSGSWSFPGGHLEYGESWEECAAREVREETGLSVVDLHFIGATNDIFAEEGRHYVTLFLAGNAVGTEPQLMEPDRCETWSWFEWDALPSPLFLPIRNLLAQGYGPRIPVGESPCKP